MPRFAPLILLVACVAPKGVAAGPAEELGENMADAARRFVAALDDAQRSKSPGACGATSGRFPSADKLSR